MERELHPRFESTTDDKIDKKDTKKATRVVALPPSLLQSVEKPTPSTEISKPAPPAESLRERLGFDKPEKTEAAYVEHDDTEIDKTLENLSDDERQHAAEKYVEFALPEVAQEALHAEPRSHAQIEALANEALLRELQARLDAENVSPEAAIDEAYEAVAETLASDIDEQPDTSPEQFQPAPQENDKDETEPIAPSASMGGKSTPPTPPTTPGGSGSASASGGGGGSSSRHGAGANTAIGVRGANTISSKEAFGRQRAARANGLIVGGLIGYFVGRRRGRIKTEKKLIPVQKKLEQQVTKLHESIAVKETQIRSLAAKKAEAEDSSRKSTEIVQKLRHNHIAPKQAEAVAPVVAAVEAARAMRKPKTAERQPEPLAKVEATKTAAKMEMPQLLEVAEAVRVGNTSLRGLYESGQLDEQSVRRVVHEHLRGGNAREYVARELIAKESPFERDPRLRATSRQQAGGAGAITDQTMEHNAANRTALPNPLTADMVSKSSRRQSNIQSERQTAVATITVILAIGAVLAIALALR